MAVSSISLVTFAVGANLVFLRMYVRMKRHITGWDDYTICVALVNAFAYWPNKWIPFTDLDRRFLF